MSNLKFVTLQELKMQMRVDFEDEDELIATFGEAAEKAVVDGTRRTESELLAIGWGEDHPGEEMPTDEAGIFPARLKVAVLLMAAHLYRNRELVAGVAQNIVPFAYDVLTKPYRKLSDR